MIAYFDIFSGISGDMTLGAFIDAGVPVEWLKKELGAVVHGFDLKTKQVKKNHLSATDLFVQIDEKQIPSRHYTDILKLIKNSSLAESVKKNSLEAFRQIAEAESAIHGTDIEKIHFHETGGIDCLVDIIGSFLSIEYLSISKVYASSIPLGSGSVHCSHGELPVPAPAVLSILKGVPVKPSDANTEIVTPTGAAIIKTVAVSFGKMPEMIVKKTGYGSGKRDTGSGLPNMLRILIGDERIKSESGIQISESSGRKQFIQAESIYSVKTNIDDMSHEILGYLMENLFENNALDVCYIPVQMKKNRPGIQIEVLCRAEDLDNMTRIILTQTTSLGVRYHKCGRAFLERSQEMIKTRFGNIEVKKTVLPDGSRKYVPEYETAKKIAAAKKTALKDVYSQINADINSM